MTIAVLSQWLGDALPPQRMNVRELALLSSLGPYLFLHGLFGLWMNARSLRRQRTFSLREAGRALLNRRLRDLLTEPTHAVPPAEPVPGMGVRDHEKGG